jgi:hypothetical protein
VGEPAKHESASVPSGLSTCRRPCFHSGAQCGLAGWFKPLEDGGATGEHMISRSHPAEVPHEAGSNFDVILEQSSDLVNWTPANPGTYSGTETKRFFRTRIVKKP